MQRRQWIALAGQAGALCAAPALLRRARAQDGAAVNTRTLTIGCTVDFSGPLAVTGQDTKNGMEAALAQINGRGGVQGRTLQLLMTDDGYQPQRSVENVRQMIGPGGAFALASCLGTQHNAAILPMIEDAGVPYVGPLSGAASLRKNARNVFHVRASYAEEVQRLAQRLAEMGIKDMGVVYLDDALGRELLEEAKSGLGAQNLKVDMQTRLAADGKNLPEVLAKAAATRPTALLLATSGTLSVELVRGLKQSVPGVLLTAVSATLTSRGLKDLGEAGSGMAVTMIMPDPNRSKNQLVRDYHAAMRAKGVQEFSMRSLEGYVNLRVLAEGLERCGADLTRSKLRNALAGIRGLDLGGFTIDYASGPPYAASRFVDLGVLNSSGRFLA